MSTARCAILVYVTGIRILSLLLIMVAKIEDEIRIYMRGKNL